MKLLSRIALALATMLALFLPTMAPATAAAPAPTGVAVPMESESACGALFHVQRVSGGFRIYAFSSDLYWICLLYTSASPWHTVAPSTPHVDCGRSAIARSPSIAVPAASGSGTAKVDWRMAAATPGVP